MLTRYLNHKVTECVLKLLPNYSLFGVKYLVKPLMGVRALKLFTEIKQPPEKLVILFSVSVSILLTKSGFFCFYFKN